MEELDRYRYAMFVVLSDTVPNMYMTIDSSNLDLSNYMSHIDYPGYNAETGEPGVYGIVYGSKDNPLQVGQIFTKKEVINSGS
jgi:hypothetical protein